jgi:hypothetical protein
MINKKLTNKINKEYEIFVFNKKKFVLLFKKACKKTKITK